MVYFIPDFYVEGIGFNALNKSRKDLLKIYNELNFKPLMNDVITVKDEKPKYYRENKEILENYVLTLLGMIDNKCSAGDFLLMDFPFAVKFLGFSKIVSYATSKKIKVVFFIHDLDGVRFQNPILNMTDSTCLDMAYSIISASKAMDKVLIEQLKVNKKIKCVNYLYWDYLISENKLNSSQDAFLCFAGNLKKSTFLKDVPDLLVQMGFKMYGNGYDPEYKGQYCGAFTPEDLVSILDGKFGLVWDGKSSSTCSGKFGKYLKINSSHKFGLYMACGKPVVVWSESAISDFVIKNKIGIAVKSLDEIPEALSKIDLVTYQKLVSNVLTIRKEVITGDHLKRVILSALN